MSYRTLNTDRAGARESLLRRNDTAKNEGDKSDDKLRQKWNFA
jgi:hypothetical protein